MQRKKQQNSTNLDDLDRALEHELDKTEYQEVENFEGSSVGNVEKIIDIDSNTGKNSVRKRGSQNDAFEDDDPFHKVGKKYRKGGSGEKNHNVHVVSKKGRKLSPKYFLFGCAVFGFVFLGLIYGTLYYVIQSSRVLESVGLKIEDVKSVLIIFAVLFFGIIFLTGFYLLVLYVYRLFTKKGQKWKYIVGLLMGVVFIGFSLVFGAISVKKIQALNGTKTLQTNLLVAPYVITRDANILADTGIPFIAPLKMKYQLNKNQIEKNVFPAIGYAPIISYTILCGNGQTLFADANIYMQQQGGMFPDHCLYMEKGTYEISLQVEYRDKKTGKKANKVFKVADFTIDAEIELEAIDDTSYYNDKKTEYIIGVAPINVKFRAQRLFTDLGLSYDRIQRDLDQDGEVDLENNASFEFPYIQSKLHTIYYRLPDLPRWSDIRFTFDLRVLESELASCALKTKLQDKAKRKYVFTPVLDEPLQVQQFHYTFYDVVNDILIEKIKTAKDTLIFSFPQGGSYQVSASYFNVAGEKGSCEPITLDIGFDNNEVDFDLKRKQENSDPFVEIKETSPLVFDKEKRNIYVDTVPVFLEITITEVVPDPFADIQVFYDGKQVFEERDDVYEIPLVTVGEKEIKFLIKTDQGDVSEQVYTVIISKDAVKADIKVEPGFVGDDPFEVILDASISSLYNEEDEIVYFTRDFGDGSSKENVSQGRVRHTYVFDEERNNGIYYPTVTVKTRLGYEDTYRLETPIVVKRKQRSVRVFADSHPTQQAKVGDVVEYRIETDGIVKSISWDFGNEKTRTCEGRSCITVKESYNKPGLYVVRVEVQYENNSPVVGSLKMKVYEK